MYKTILVHLNDERRAASLLAPALDLARRANAHVIGLHVYPGIVMAPPLAMPYGTEVIGSVAQEERLESERLRWMFEEATRNQTLVPEWREVKATHADLAGIVIEHAMAADIVVAGQADPGWDLAPVLDFPERIALEGGRPTLVVPYAGTYPSVGRRIMVAWNGRRESARATFDALPLLRAAEAVTLLSVASGSGTPYDAGDLEIAAALARHDVKVTTHRTTAPETSIGSEILNRVADHGSDLLVMGAYGHSRLRELIFGGVTREISEHMTVPTLLSH